MQILVVQRRSNVATANFSLSIAARISEVLDYLALCCGVSPIQMGAQEITDRVLINADVVFFNKHLSVNAFRLAEKAKKHGCLIIYDIDDYLFEFPQYSGARGVSNSTLKTFLDLADYVTVANERLRAEMSGLRSDAILMPNGFFMEKYLPVNGKERSPPCIILTNADELKIQHFKGKFLTLLQNFFHKYQDTDLDFFGDQIAERISLPFMHYTERIPYEDYLYCLRAGGYIFAIVPLGGKEDEASFKFNSCKNPFKYLNYGGLKIPGIYSRSPIYEEVIEHGRTGLLVDNTPEAWGEAMKELRENGALRATIRQHAFEDVYENWHIRKQADVLAQILGLAR
ncbi:glycosyltransferase [Desulfovibrio sp. OttesenSCG-928-M14]|nr:glycosyltransferase [Desulfovibrio sp. OttesenSCG-928-M14]